MTQHNIATALMGLITETSLHAGAGSASGAIDLPIQREGHNNWPCVFGSGVKGALRNHSENLLDPNDPNHISLFGPNTQNASDHAGALAVGDARLLLLPVRSLTSPYRWVTCPDALQRLQRDSQRLGLANHLTFTIPSVSGADALICENTDSPSKNHALFLEEYRFNEQTHPDINKLIIPLSRLIDRLNINAQLTNKLTLISDIQFQNLSQVATPINAHIALDSATKTTTGGALWYEETLPPETVLYTTLMTHPSRNPKHPQTALELMNHLSESLTAKPWLQMGGNETVGMGWCQTTLIKEPTA